MAGLGATRESGDEQDDGGAVASADIAYKSIARAVDRVRALADSDSPALLARALLQLTDVTAATERLAAAQEQLRRRRIKVARVAEEGYAACLEDRRGGLRAV